MSTHRTNQQRQPAKPDPQGVLIVKELLRDCTAEELRRHAMSGSMTVRAAAGELMEEMIGAARP